jgi:tetratricopeptide (TPR) repeat protein
MRLLVALPAIAVLAWAAIFASDTARANLLVLDSLAEMRAARASWDGISEWLLEAKAIRATDPTTHEILGLLSLARASEADRLEDGIAHLERALELRPASPFAWANLADARYRRGDAGPHLELPLQRAAELGPSEPGVQRIVGDLGLAVWDEVGPSTKAAVDRMVAAGIRRNPLEMLQISERRGRLDVACRHLADYPRKVGPRRGSLCPWEITP